MAFLKKQQRPEGGWEEFRNHNCGLSALCTLALLNCGLTESDPAVAGALQYLRKFSPNDTYSVSLQTMVLCFAGEARDLPVIRTNVAWLRKAQLPVGAPRAGSWTYGAHHSAGDPSNTQFALLALSAAEDRGIPVPNEVFQRAEQFWLKRQSRGGGWAYSVAAPGQFSAASGSMTCAGVASLVITRGRRGAGQARIENGKIQCCASEVEPRDAIGDGIGWLAKNFLIRSNPGTGNNTLYYLYALERVGRLTGQRLIGGHDWYREGADYLLSIQDDFDGSWTSASPGEKRPTIATSFALLFLSKGKRKVVISRVIHGAGEDWNRHPDALRQLTRHVERDWNQHLTWQTVRWAGAQVEDLLHCPVLFISGSGPVVATAQQREVLKQYVMQGGFVFAQASVATGCRQATEFEQSFRKLVEDLFDAPLEKLPANHPIWQARHPLRPTTLPPNFWLYGVQACCRTSIVYSPVSLACLWELSDPNGRTDVPERFKPAVRSATHLGENVIAYATGRQLPEKLNQPTVIQPQNQAAQFDRGLLTVARLPLGAGGEQAPRALPNLMEWMRRQVAARISSQTKTVSLDREVLQAYPIVFAHGRYDFSLSEQQRNVLREYLESGGSLIATSICGSEEFTQAFRREIGLVLPGQPLAPMPASHPAFTSRYRGFDLTSIPCNHPNQGAGGIVVNKKVGPPLIESIGLEDRDCVFFSPFDLSCALENQGGIQCPGYATTDAAKIGINLVLYVMTQ